MAISSAAAGTRARAASSPYWVAWLATITFFAGFYALLVPLPRYLAAVDLPDWQIGVVLGAFGVASLVGRPIAGVASDRLGSRGVMFVGAASLALGALGVAATTSVVVLFGLRVLQAVGYVAFTTAGTALVVSLVGPEERASRLAVFGAAANMAISLTPAAIARLLEVAPVEAGLVVAAAFAALGGLLAVLLPTTVVSAASESEIARAIEWAIPRRLWLPMLTAGLLGAGFAAFFQFAPILAERRGVSSGLLYAIYGAAILGTRLVGGRLLDRFDVGRVVALAAALMALGHTLIASSNSFAPLVGAAALIAASGGLFHPALIARHAALLPAAPGRASAAFYVAFDLGIGLGSWLFGVALQLAGLPGLYWTAAALALAALPFASLLSTRKVTLDMHNVRDAIEDDLGRILEITNQAIEHTTAIWSLEPTTVDERRAWFRARRERGYPVLVAEGPDGSVLGFASYGEFRPREGYRHTVEHSIYVDEAERGRGIGTALLSALIDRAVVAGVHVMVGGIDCENAGSIRLHERFGFATTGQLLQVGRKFDRWLDLVFMQRILAGAGLSEHHSPIPGRD
jgi:L-amino acid N-acyltransferase